ncbi:MAG: hypothetical protein WCI20_03615 [bacterium]
MNYAKIDRPVLVRHPDNPILEEDGAVIVHYGGADTVQCVATGKLTDIIHACKHW